MPIDLPLTPGPANADPYFIDAGGWQRPTTTGPATRVDMLGDRFGVAVQLPPMQEPEALAWVKALNKGRGEGVTFEFPANYDLPVNDIGTPAEIRSISVAQATTIDLRFVGVNVTFEDGRFISINSGGHNYLHQVDGEQIIDGNGLLNIFPRTRAAFSVADPVMIDRPKIDGILLGNQSDWTVNAALHYGLSFTIEEME